MTTPPWTDKQSLHLYTFVGQSNYIEGINREPLPEELEAHKALLALDTVTIPDLQNFVAMVAPGHKLRDKLGLNVKVGDHFPPAGGEQITELLTRLLGHWQYESSFASHREYEWIHPFTDGNGRSGRAFWLWTQKKRGNLEQALSLGFLHLWYYESLQSYDGED